MGNSKIKAYLLINLDAADREVERARILSFSCVIGVEFVTSMYDAICTVEANDLKDLSKRVGEITAAVPAIQKCTTCVVT